MREGELLAHIARRGARGPTQCASGRLGHPWRAPAHRAGLDPGHHAADRTGIGGDSAPVLSMVADGCGLDCGPAKGPAPLVRPPNLPSARAEAVT